MSCSLRKVDFSCDVYAFTSAKAMVLLVPSVMSAMAMPPLGRLLKGITPSPPMPVLGFHTSHVPTFAP